jgi:cellulose 1,4-beta-cellobiosidase
MKYLLSLAALAAVVFATPTPTVEERAPAAGPGACSSAQTIAPGSNIFATKTLHANSVYASEIAAAMANVTSATVKTQASEIAKVGTFLWM